MNSPLGKGRLTAIIYFEQKVFDKFRVTAFDFESIAAYDNYIKSSVKTNRIENAKKIGRTSRVHPFFNTVEFRILRCAYDYSRRLSP